MRKTIGALALISFVGLSACATNPETGQRELAEPVENLIGAAMFVCVASALTGHPEVCGLSFKAAAPI